MTRLKYKHVDNNNDDYHSTQKQLITVVGHRVDLMRTVWRTTVSAHATQDILE